MKDIVAPHTKNKIYVLFGREYYSVRQAHNFIGKCSLRTFQKRIDSNSAWHVKINDRPFLTQWQMEAQYCYDRELSEFVVYKIKRSGGNTRLAYMWGEEEVKNIVWEWLQNNDVTVAREPKVLRKMVAASLVAGNNFPAFMPPQLTNEILVCKDFCISSHFAPPRKMTLEEDFTPDKDTPLILEIQQNLDDVRPFKHVSQQDWRKFKEFFFAGSLTISHLD